MNWQTFTRAEGLPAGWDELAGENIFLRREFLTHLERVNPCRQAYTCLELGGRLVAICVDYALKLDIFTYSVLSLKLPVQIVGIPCSVSKPGFAVKPGYEQHLAEHVRSKKGAKLVLNSDIPLGLARGETLPDCRMEVRWPSFEAYLLSMRANYRHRVNKALKQWDGVKVVVQNPLDFDQELYRMYEQTFARSNAKLEKLSLDFFRHIPLEAWVIKAEHQGKTLGFVMVVKNNDELIFLFTGFDQGLNRRYDTYFNLLLEIVKFGIGAGFRVINLGQTAEETKLKLGSKLYPKAMFLCHANPVVDRIAGGCTGFLSYKTPAHRFNVFK